MAWSKITWVAILSRSFIIKFQMIANYLTEDPYILPWVFRSPFDHNVEGSIWDYFNHHFFGGLRHWDAEYFLHIAEYGYTYENLLAFQPLFPWCIALVKTILTPLNVFMTPRSFTLLVAVWLNVVIFVKAANVLHELARCVLKDERKAEIATILFCFNPASIFFSAAYSESLFSLICFSLMLKCVKDFDSTMVEILLGLSILCRSNGILNIGFAGYFAVKRIFSEKSIFVFIKMCFKVLKCLVCAAVAFGIIQIVNYYYFCFTNSFDFPNFIKGYADWNSLILAGNWNGVNNVSSWCLNKVPVAYGYIQSQYWSVGFLKYYKWSQIPNFILAAPIVYIILRHSLKYYLRNKEYCWRLGIFDLKKSIMEKTSIEDQNSFIFIAHAVFFTIFCVLFAHVQVTTRLLAASNPMLYFFCADYFMSSYGTHEKKDAVDMIKSMFDKKRLNLTQRYITYYFLGYACVGTYLFSNFMHWT